MSIKKLVLLPITLLLITNPALAAEDSAFIANRAELIASLYAVVTSFASLLGLILMGVGAHKLKRRAENPNDPRSFPSSIVVTLIAGALIFNYSMTSNTMISTILGNESGHCFMFTDSAKERLEESAANTGTTMSDASSLVDENCWDSASSSMVGDISAKLDEMSPGKGDAFKRNVGVIVGLFQLFGVIYLIKGVYLLKQTSEGNGREGYGKPIITMIAAALVIDLPHTLEMIKATIDYLGFSGG
tara:strand:+ start:16675 stop:17409 length:735 start_codon:yes stop_codon:yes gene_type:complete